MSTAPASFLRRWGPWLAMAVVVVALLIVGTVGSRPPTADERARGLEESIRCPSCASQSVASSDTPSAKGVKVAHPRADHRRRRRRGDPRLHHGSRYPSGYQLLLTPAGKGFGALVWGVPVVAAVVAVGALVYRFGDWRPSTRPVTAADRELVAVALGEPVEPGSRTGAGGSDSSDGSAS